MITLDGMNLMVNDVCVAVCPLDGVKLLKKELSDIYGYVKSSDELVIQQPVSPMVVMELN